MPLIKQATIKLTVTHKNLNKPREICCMTRPDTDKLTTSALGIRNRFIGDAHILTIWKYWSHDSDVIIYLMTSSCALLVICTSERWSMCTILWFSICCNRDLKYKFIDIHFIFIQNSQKAHNCDVTCPSMLLKSPATRLFVQQLVGTIAMQYWSAKRWITFPKDPTMQRTSPAHNVVMSTTGWSFKSKTKRSLQLGQT